MRDGILTCHWHHAKFDLAGGCTLDPFADDATCFAVDVRDGLVYVDPQPGERDRKEHWLHKLQEGLKQNLRLVLAKSVIGLDQPGRDQRCLGQGRAVRSEQPRRRVEYRPDDPDLGGSVLSEIAPEDQRLAVYQGLIHVARSTANQPRNFDLEPLATTEAHPERYVDWFRRFVDSRSEDAAERTLRTAIRVGVPRETIATMIFAACTDHLYMDEGHSLDFANKGFELLDHIGWEQAEAVLPSLVPTSSQHHERKSDRAGAIRSTFRPP